MVSPQGAVDSVRQSDQQNERSASFDSSSCEWLNPSKALVDKALERWSTRKMRADNTSVVIIMFDPPGPPKRDVIKSASAKSHLLGYLPSESDDQPSQHLEIEPVQNLAMYDHNTNELIDMDGLPLPMNGATILTRYDNIPENEDQTPHYQQAYSSHSVDHDVANGNEDHYMNSFAESYNSLLNSSLNEDNSYVYDNDMNEDSDFDDSNSYDNPNTTHQYMERSHDATYSLHKLKTRSEQQFDYDAAMPSTSSGFSGALSVMPSTSQLYGCYENNMVDHNYLGDASPSTSSEYTHHETDEETAVPLHTSEYFNQPISSNEFVSIAFLLLKDREELARIALLPHLILCPPVQNPMK